MFLELDERVQPGSVIAIDGKAVRGSAAETGKAVLLASAWASELGLAGCIVTIDAMGCQKQLAADIVRGKAFGCIRSSRTIKDVTATVALA